MAKPLFHHVPGRARYALVGLLLLGMLWLIFGAVCVYVLVQDGADGFREYASACLLALGFGAIAAMVLLALRQPAGRIVAWFVLPFFLLFFPIGTVAGAFVIIGLHSEDMRAFLRRA